MSDRALIVFVKYPAPGQVKTRLIPDLGPELATDLYRAMSEEVLAATVPGVGEYERLVFFAPGEAVEDMRAWLPGVRLLPQAGPDLGARMVDAFARAFARGATRAAIIGTDSPAVSRDTVGEALEALDDGEVVLGPAEDGGYYLLALRQPRPDLFEGVAWSTPSVAEETVARAEQAGLAVRLLARQRDVDTAADLKAVWTQLGPLLASRPELRQRIQDRLGLT